MVADDMVRILEKILHLHPPPSVDQVAPTTSATLGPAANDAGWHHGDVVVDLDATDPAGGAGVKQIDYSLTGAQVGGAVIEGAAAQDIIVVEGVTTVRVFATDNAGNVESPQDFDVRIDRTPPSINAVLDVPPNAAGWHRNNVHVDFIASDALSGLKSTAPGVNVSNEGADQEINGSAEDHAGNEGTAGVIINLDITAPAAAIALPLDGSVYSAGMVHPASFDCSDALSGVASCIGTTPNGSPIDTSTVGQKTFLVSVEDVAGNVSTLAHHYTVIAGTPRLSVAATGKGIEGHGVSYVDLTFTNTGSGLARNIVLKSFAFRTLSGTGTVTLDTMQSSVPLIIGDLMPSVATTRRFYLKRPTTATRISVTESISLTDASGRLLSVSASQSVIF
jgi:hypothetical protein